MGVSVHPRVCGEQPLGPLFLSHNLGSSPRVRGTGPVRLDPSHRQRFIPACAGNSGLKRVPQSRLPVHPRVCGEQFINTGVDIAGVGSSPRVRGTGARAREPCLVGRFIPACAGNSVRPVTAVLFSPVHPRVCGEQSQQRNVVSRHAGSSPRVRGTEQQSKIDHDNGRFIPACAGNSLVEIPGSKLAPVHPRVCGEQVVLALANYQLPASHEFRE